ncbi:hypothetical protein QNK12_06510 [Neobacillus cucumis]|nr:hypothetical protein QNK12_06510 [Neobacillus cucumis]
MEIFQVGFDRQREFDTIRTMLRHESQKKLDAIQFYLGYHHQLGVVIESIEDLFAFLNTNEATDEILWGILELLEQSFSRGYPNYIFEFQLKAGFTDSDLAQLLDESIPIGTPLSPTRQENTIVTRVGNIIHEQANFIKFKVEYERRKTNPRGGALSGALEIKTSFDIIFDFTCSLCYIQCGDKKLLSAIDDIMRNKVVGVFSKFCSYELKQKQIPTVFEGEYSLDKQTVIILDYVEVEINKENHEISDYSGMSFSNLRSDKVKSVRLKGNNLLESSEVSERIRMGDQIKSIRFQLRKRLNNGNYLMPTISIDFNGPLKITLNNMENTNYNTDFTRYLVKALNHSLAKVYREEETKERLTNIIHRARVRESMYIQSVLAEIRDQLDEVAISSSEKEKVIQILDSYRL